MRKKKHYPGNIYISTTIFAVIGTAAYFLILKFLYKSQINLVSVVAFFVVFWIVYLWVTRRAYRRFLRKN